MRKTWRILVWSCGLLIFLIAFLFWQWQQLLARLDISDLQWELGNLAFRSAHLTELRFTKRQADYRLQVELTDLQVSWHWQRFMPALHELAVRDLALGIQPGEQLVEISSPDPFTLPENWQLPENLPQAITLERVRVNMPCAQGRCEITGQARTTLAENLLTLEAHLADTPTPVTVDLLYEVRNGLPHLRLTLRAPQLLQFSGSTSLAGVSAPQLWQSDFQLDIQPPNEQWLDYLRRWYPISEQQAERFNQPLQATAAWQLAVPPLLAETNEVIDLASAVQLLRDHLHGNAQLSLDLPAPVPIPGVGGVSGQVQLELHGESGQIRQHRVDVDAQIAPVILPEFATGYDLEFNHLHLTLHSRAETELDLLALPVELQVSAKGRQEVNANATIIINSENLDVDISQANLQLRAAQWAPLENVTLTNLTLSQRFSANWRAGELVYQQTEPGLLAADVASSMAQVKGGQLHLQQLQLRVDPVSWQAGDIHFKGALSAAELLQAELKPQSWRWQGEVKASDRRISSQGKLLAGDGLALDHQLQLDEKQWRLDWQLADIFLLAGNSFQQLTPRWPSLLTLARGRIGGEGWVTADGAGNNLRGAMSWRLADVTGIYDTTAFKGISGNVHAALEADAVRVSSNNLTISEIAQGVMIGPVRLQGNYHAATTDIAKGKLDLGQAEADFLGGQVLVPPVTVDLARADQQLLIELVNIDLGKLLETHPSSELSGSGKLSGNIPLVLSPQGLSVAKGIVAAQAPGGQLQYNSQRAADMAATSQGMKIVTDALSDFHYTLLSSEVTYEQDGTLLLGVRLEGSNPAVENGRAINFNVTLEEDLPAMITSLQLSNQISDVIKKRVQEKLQQRASP